MKKFNEEARAEILAATSWSERHTDEELACLSDWTYCGMKRTTCGTTSPSGSPAEKILKQAGLDDFYRGAGCYYHFGATAEEIARAHWEENAKEDGETFEEYFESVATDFIEGEYGTFERQEI